MKPPASPNAQPAFSHVLVFLLAVIMFSISYAVSSLAVLCRPQPTREHCKRSDQPSAEDTKVLYFQRPAGFQFRPGNTST